jgi:hypothetical protein
MKAMTAVAVGAAFFSIISFSLISAADAQNAPTTQTSPSPASVNKSSLATKQSGSESRAAATDTRRRVAGHGRYCSQSSARGTLDCYYASMSACHKHAKSNNLNCVTNPDRG